MPWIYKPTSSVPNFESIFNFESILNKFSSSANDSTHNDILPLWPNFENSPWNLVLTQTVQIEFKGGVPPLHEFQLAYWSCVFCDPKQGYHANFCHFLLVWPHWALKSTIFCHFWYLRIKMFPSYLAFCNETGYQLLSWSVRCPGGTIHAEKISAL